MVRETAEREATRVAREVRPHDAGFAAVISAGGIYAGHPDEGRLSKKADDLPADALAAVGRGAAWEGEIDLNGTRDVVRLTPVTFGAAKSVWPLLIAVPEGAIFAETNRPTWLCVLVGVVFPVGAAVTARMIGRSVAKPVASTTRVMGELADGRNDVSVPFSERRDEVGATAARSTCSVGT